MMGSWTMASKVYFNGTMWTNIVAENRCYILRFHCRLVYSGDRAIEPGATTTLTWIVSNIGNTDTLTIELGQTWWHDNGQNGNVISINAGESTSIVVPVTVPLTQ